MFLVSENKIIYMLNEKEVGYVLFSNKDDKTISIDKVFVNESNRGQGLAKKMLAYTSDYFNSQGIKLVYECSYSKKWEKLNK